MVSPAKNTTKKEEGKTSRELLLEGVIRQLIINSEDLEWKLVAKDIGSKRPDNTHRRWNVIYKEIRESVSVDNDEEDMNGPATKVAKLKSKAKNGKTATKKRKIEPKGDDDDEGIKSDEDFVLSKKMTKGKKLTSTTNNKKQTKSKKTESDTDEGEYEITEEIVLKQRKQPIRATNTGPRLSSGNKIFMTRSARQKSMTDATPGMGDETKEHEEQGESGEEQDDEFEGHLEEETTRRSVKPVLYQGIFM